MQQFFATKPRAQQEKYFWKNSSKIYKWVKRADDQPTPLAQGKAAPPAPARMGPGGPRGPEGRPAPRLIKRSWGSGRQPDTEFPIWRSNRYSWFHGGSMKTYITFRILLLLITGTASAQCSGAPKYHAQLQWSEPAQVGAPSHAWAAEVHPVLDADENRTPVTLHRRRDTGSWPLFTLERSAELHWGTDSNHVLVINEPLSGTNKLLFFSVASLITGTEASPPDGLDRAVNEALAERLGKKRSISSSTCPISYRGKATTYCSRWAVRPILPMSVPWPRTATA